MKLSVICAVSLSLLSIGPSAEIGGALLAQYRSLPDHTAQGMPIVSHGPPFEISGDLYMGDKLVAALAKLFSEGKVDRVNLARGFFDQRGYVRFACVGFLSEQILSTEERNTMPVWNPVNDPFLSPQSWAAAEWCKERVLRGNSQPKPAESYKTEGKKRGASGD